MAHLVERAASALGVSERRLAHLIGVDPTTTFRWKRGDKAMPGNARVLLELCLRLPARDVRRELELLESERRSQADADAI